MPGLVPAALVPAALVPAPLALGADALVPALGADALVPDALALGPDALPVLPVKLSKIEGDFAELFTDKLSLPTIGLESVMEGEEDNFASSVNNNGLLLSFVVGDIDFFMLSTKL